MIQSFVLELSTEDEMLKAADKLWNKWGVRGEMEMCEHSSGTWRLSVHSESKLRDSVLEKLPGKMIQGKSLGGGDKKRGTEDDAESS